MNPLNVKEVMAEAARLAKEATWTTLPPPEEEPEALAFQGKTDDYNLTVIGKLPDADGRQSVGGAMFNASRGVVINLPVETAKILFDAARQFLNKTTTPP